MLHIPLFVAASCWLQYATIAVNECEFRTIVTVFSVCLQGVLNMSATIEERVAMLEKELLNLKQLIRSTRVEKDWRKTFGLSANDPGFDEMIRLGREIRKQDREDNV